MGITVIRNDYFTEEVKTKLMNKYDNNREGLHVSDITFCFLQRMLLQINPNKRLMTWKKAKAFERGIQSEATIVSLYPDGETQKEGKFLKYIEAHPDLIIKSGKLIVELKNTDRDQLMDPNSDDFMLYLRQLVYYMVLNEVERGMISIAYNSKRVEEDLVSYEVILKMNDPLREKLKKNLERFEYFYEEIVLKKNHDAVKGIPRIAGYPASWKCKFCEVNAECKALDVNATIEDIKILRNYDIDTMVNVVG